MAVRRRIDGSYDEDQNGVLRKRNKGGGCLKKLIIGLLVTLGIIAVIIVGALIAGNAVLNNMFGVSLFDMFGVVGDLGSANRTEIVTNPYDEDDVDGFYDSANELLYFKSGEGAVLNAEYVYELLGDVTSGESEDEIFNSLLGLLSSENFDKDKLSSYTGWKEGVEHSSTLSTVSDREFCAFLDDLVFNSGVLETMLGDSLSFSGDTKLGDLLNLDQLIISKEQVAPTSALTLNDNAEVYSSASVMMTLTMSLNLDKTVDAVFNSMPDFPSFLGGIAKFFLPDEIFVTATVDMTDASKGIELEINSLGDETCSVTAKPEILAKYGDGNGNVTKMERIFVIIESFSGMDVRQAIDDATAPVLGYLCKGADTEVPFCFADVIDLDSVTSTNEGNTFKIDLFGMLTDVINAQTNGSARPEDIVVLMQALLCTDADVYSGDYAHRADLYYNPTASDMAEALTACGFTSLDDIKTQEDYEAFKEAYGAIEYKKFGVSLDESYVNAYSQELLNEIEASLCLNLDGYNFADVLALLGFSEESADVELTELIDGARLAELAKPENEATTMQITDRMLGAIIIEILPEMLGESYEQYGIDLRTIAISERVVDGTTHDLVTIKFTIELGGLISGDIKTYLENVLPDYVTFGATVDITGNLNGAERLPLEIACFNDVTNEGSADVLNGLTSDELIDAIERLIPDVDLDSMFSSVTEGLNSAIDGLNEVLPYYDFVPSSADNSGYVELPTIFDLAVELLELNEGEDGVDGDDLKSVVNYLVNYAYDGEDNSAGASDDEFLRNVQRNYYIYNDGQPLESFDQIFEIINSGLSLDKLRVEGEVTYE